MSSGGIDARSGKSFKQSITPAAYTADEDGASVNNGRAHSIFVEYQVGTITDGTHTPVVQRSADNSVWEDVPLEDLIQKPDSANGTVLAALVSDTVVSVGVKGLIDFPWIRATTVVAGASTGGIYGAVVVLDKQGAVGPDSGEADATAWVSRANSPLRINPAHP